MKSIFDFMATASKHTTGEDVLKIARTLYKKHLDDDHDRAYSLKVVPVNNFID